MAVFKAFKPEAMNKIAGAMGYQGDMGQFQQYIEQDPARQQQMNMYTNAAQKMAAGGMAHKKFAPGGTVTAQTQTNFAAPTQNIQMSQISPNTLTRATGENNNFPLATTMMVGE